MGRLVKMPVQNKVFPYFWRGWGDRLHGEAALV